MSMTTRQPVPTKGAESAQKALRWRGPWRKSWARKRTFKFFIKLDFKTWQWPYLGMISSTLLSNIHSCLLRGSSFCGGWASKSIHRGASCFLFVLGVMASSSWSGLIWTCPCGRVIWMVSVSGWGLSWGFWNQEKIFCHGTESYTQKEVTFQSQWRSWQWSWLLGLRSRG